MIDEHFRATIEARDGVFRKLSITAKDYFATKLNKLPVGHKVWVHVYDKEPKRSDAQNRYYHVYLNNIAEETGNDHDALHEHFKRQYLAIYPRQTIKTHPGEEIEVQTYKSTTQLSKHDFSEYLKKIERDTGILLPETDTLEKGYKLAAHEAAQTADYPDDDTNMLADKF